jgi:hypothetical protein
MKKGVDWFASDFVKDLVSGLDKLFTSSEEKIKAEGVIKEIIAKKQVELQKLQSKIILTEVKGDWLQRSWRPILMLVFGFIVLYVKVIAPIFGLNNPPLENEFWGLLQIGIGGYVIGRTGEKMMNSFTENKK